MSEQVSIVYGQDYIIKDNLVVPASENGVDALNYVYANHIHPFLEIFCEKVPGTHVVRFIDTSPMEAIHEALAQNGRFIDHTRVESLAKLKLLLSLSE
jgi:hypothetical protein